MDCINRKSGRQTKCFTLDYCNLNKTTPALKYNAADDGYNFNKIAFVNTKANTMATVILKLNYNFSDVCFNSVPPIINRLKQIDKDGKSGLVKHCFDP
jgi:hypothetical protein